MRWLLQVKASTNDFGRTVPSAVSKIGNGVIPLLWQLQCLCNPDYKKFSFLSNTTVVAIFPNICLWRHSLCSNLGGICWPWKTVSSHLKNVNRPVDILLIPPEKLTNNWLKICRLHWLLKLTVGSYQMRWQMMSTM